MPKALIPALMLALALALPGRAEELPEEPVVGTLLPGWQQADGTRMAALRLELAPGWKTYWRSPGDAGIPPQIDWSGSRNLAGVALHWPAPRVYREGGVTTVGYKDVLVLPVTLRPTRPGAMEVTAALDIGVCKDVCIPHRMTIEGTIADGATSPSPVIAAALAARPLSAREGGLSSATCALRPSADGLEITAELRLPPLGGREMVVIEPGRAEVWASEMDVTRQGGTLRAVGDLAALSGGTFALDRSALTITVLGDGQAVEIRGCQPG